MVEPSWYISWETVGYGGTRGESSSGRERMMVEVVEHSHFCSLKFLRVSCFLCFHVILTMVMLMGMGAIVAPLFLFRVF